MGVRIGGSITGGLTNDAEVHTDNLQGLEKLPQANGGVPAIVTSHMTGNNKEGIVGGIDNRGIDKDGVKTDFHKR
jgi:hypothetical protein